RGELCEDVAFSVSANTFAELDARSARWGHGPFAPLRSRSVRPAEVPFRSTFELMSALGGSTFATPRPNVRARPGRRGAGAITPPAAAPRCPGPAARRGSPAPSP